MVASVNVSKLHKSHTHKTISNSQGDVFVFVWDVKKNSNFHHPVFTLFDQIDHCSKTKLNLAKIWMFFSTQDLYFPISIISKVFQVAIAKISVLVAGGGAQWQELVTSLRSWRCQWIDDDLTEMHLNEKFWDLNELQVQTKHRCLEKSSTKLKKFRFWITSVDQIYFFGFVFYFFYFHFHTHTKNSCLELINVQLPFNCKWQIEMSTLFMLMRVHVR